MDRLQTDKFKICLSGFKYLYLAYLLLAFNAFVNGSTWMAAASYVITVLGVILVFWMLLQRKKYLKMYNIRILTAFILSYGISMALHLSYGILENVKGTVWLVLPIFLIYLTAGDMSGEEIKKEMAGLSWMYVLYCTAVNIVSISMVCWGRKYNFIDGNGIVHAIGYRWNRLWGIYDDPNHGGTITMAALFMIAYLFFRAKSTVLRILFVVMAAVNYVYLTLSDSRTAILGLAAGVLFGGIFLVWRMPGKRKKEGPVRSRMAMSAAVLSAAVLIIAGNCGIKAAYAPVDAVLAEKYELKINGNTPVNQRKQDLQQDVSNGRLQIWEGGLEIVKTSPVFGVGYRNIAPYAKDHFSEGYLVNNPNGVRYDSMHNLEMDVLVSQGIVGALIFVLFIGNLLFLLAAKGRKIPEKYESEAVFAFGAAGALGMASTFLSFIFYVNAPQNYCFWLFLGYLMQFIRMGEETCGQRTPYTGEETGKQNLSARFRGLPEEKTGGLAK